MYSGRKASHYLQAENVSKVGLSEIPKMIKLKSPKHLSNTQKQTLKEFCVEYKGLAQVSTRAFTSKFKAGTLPLQAYDVLDDADSIGVPAAGRKKARRKQAGQQ